MLKREEYLLLTEEERRKYFAELSIKEQLDILPDDFPKDYSIVDSGFKFKTEPYKHQIVQFNRHKDMPASALFDDMGTGKSKIAIDIAVYKYCTKQIDAVLVIAPNNVHSQWLNEQFKVHCSIDYVSMLWQASKSNTHQFNDALEDFLTPKCDKLKVFAVNVEAFQYSSILQTIASYVKNNKVFIIIDEATRIKTPSAKRSETIHKLEKYGQRIILTGTPTTKNPFSLWSMFEFLKSNYFTCNYFMFQAKYGVMMQGINNKSNARYKTLIDEKSWNIALNKLNAVAEQRGGKLIYDDYCYVAQATGLTEKNVEFIWTQKNFVKYRNLDLLKEQIEPITSYAKKEECLDLPPKIYELVHVEMSDEHRKIYKTLKTQLIVQYESHELTALNKAALTTRLMQVCGGFFPYTISIETLDGEYELEKHTKPIGTTNAKIERMCEDLEELSSFPIIIWARFIVELKAIYERLRKDYNCALYYGDTIQSERENIIRDFKAGKYDIFIGNPATAGFGLNLQNASTQFYYSNDFNVENRLQAEDRSHRLGVKNACLYKDYIYKDTIEEKIVTAIKDGRDMNDFFKTQSLREILD